MAQIILFVDAEVGVALEKVTRKEKAIVLQTTYQRGAQFQHRT